MISSAFQRAHWPPKNNWVGCYWRQGDRSEGCWGNAEYEFKCEEENFKYGEDRIH